MKKLFAAMLIVLAGCVSAPTFDAVEYDHFVEFTHLVRQAPQYCGTDPMSVMMVSQMIDHLKIQANRVNIYAAYRPDHEEIQKIVTIVSKELEEMNKAYGKTENVPSKAYCQGKFKILDSSLTKVLNTVGGLPQQ